MLWGELRVTPHFPPQVVRGRSLPFTVPPWLVDGAQVGARWVPIWVAVLCIPVIMTKRKLDELSSTLNK